MVSVYTALQNSLNVSTNKIHFILFGLPPGFELGFINYVLSHKDFMMKFFEQLKVYYVEKGIDDEITKRSG